MLDVVCVGEAVWDLRARRPLDAGDAAFDARPGGAAINCALALARRGASVRVCGPVGGDPLGRALVARMAASGVPLRSVAAGAMRTGLVFRTGDSVVGYRAPDDERRSLLRAVSGWVPTRALHIASLLPRRGPSPCARAARSQRAAGGLLTVDINARPRLWPPGSRIAWAAIALADVVKCSRADLVALGLRGRASDQVDGVRTRMRGAAILLVTDGPRPTLVLGPFGQARVRPPAARIPDPMGAGDAFCASVLWDLIAERCDGTRAGWVTTVERAHRVAQAATARASRRTVRP